MNDLGLFIKNDAVMVSSIKVSENYKKQHKVVLKAIKDLIEAVPDIRHNFVPIEYEDDRRRKQPCYEMDRQGFSMLVMGFTGAEAKKFTYEYTRAFELMIQERQQPLLPVAKITEQQNLIAENLYNFVMSQRDFNIEQQKVNLNHDERLRALEEQKANEIVVDDYEVSRIKPRTQYELHNMYSATQIGAAFGLSGMRINKMLYDFGLQYPYQQGSAWLVAKRFKGQGLSREVTRVISNSEDRTPREQTVGWTEKGVQIICDLLRKKGFEQIAEVSNKVKARRLHKRGPQKRTTLPRSCIAKTVQPDVTNR